MAKAATLDIRTWPGLKVQNGGYFMSRGRGIHPRRVIQSYELIFVNRGEMHIRELKTDFVVREGQTLILWPDRLHEGTQPFPPDLGFYWIHFELKPAPAARGAAGSVGTLHIPQLATLERPSRMEEVFRRYLEDQEAGRFGPIQKSLYMTWMLAEISERAPAPREEQAVEDLPRFATRIDQHLKTHFHERIRTATVAKALQSNPDYLGRVYARAYGVSVTEAIHQYRLKHARSLLLDSDARISEVAYDCGFSDEGYFRRVFRRAEGMTPSEYRKLHGRMHVNTQ
jgi:AraC-like DNA-binding protein